MPEGIPNPNHLVCRLKKSIYGLKQASRQWFHKLTSALHSRGYSQSRIDYCLFTKKKSGLITILAVYVDDLLLTGSDSTEINNLKTYLHTTFSIKDLGSLHYFLGLEINHTNSGIAVTQHKFTTELLHDSAIELSKCSLTHLPLHLKLNATDGALLHDPTQYRILVGKLNLSYTY